MTSNDGTERRADFMTLDTQFTHIVADNLRTRFTDGSFFIADESDTVTGDRSVFSRSRFSPCNCDIEKGESPNWDVRATSSIHNEKTQTITHKNVRMHVLNVPLFYLPYLAHPDWTVRRRTGFLTPSTSISSDRGITPAVPYFKIIDDTSDARFTVYKYQYRGIGLRTDYRKRWDNADLDVQLLNGSVSTYKKDRENVAAINAIFRTNIGNDWNIKALVNRASQDTFMRRYKFDGSTTLTSSVTAERLKENRYYLVEASDLQGLNSSDTPELEPVILPSIFYEKLQQGWRPNQKLRTEISAIQLDNDEEHDLARWSGTTEVAEEFHRGAFVNSYKANVMASYYSLHDKPVGATSKLGESGQINPSVSIGTRLPLAVSGFGKTAMFEPKAQIVWVGGADRTQEVPNRDAADYRIDEANLFLLNRYQGKDYILPGTRADLGVSGVANDQTFGKLAGFIGLSRRISGKPSEGLAPDQGNIYSDYVASLSINPPQNIALSWSGRMSSHDFSLNESKTDVSTKLGKLNLALEHNQLAKAYFANSTDDREELILRGSVPLGRGWSASADQNWDLSAGQETRQKTNAALVWNGGVQNCITIRFDYSHDATKDRDVSRVDEIKFTFNFKYLGAIGKDDVSKFSSSSE
jgi:LPS-assembly protein